MDNEYTKPVRLFKGVNNVSRPEELGYDEFTSAENVFITDRQSVAKRSGHTQLLSSTSLHSLGGSLTTALVVNNSELCVINDDNSLTPIRGDMTPFLRVSYQPIGGAIFYSNGQESGKVVNNISRNWAVSTPLTPTLSIGDGALPAGVYRVALTYTDKYGEESGATDYRVITLSQPSGIVVTMEPIAEGTLNIYMTTTDGAELYLYGTTTVGGTVRVGNETAQSRPLETNLLSEMPPGHIVRYYNSRLLVANGSSLWFSEPYRYGLTKIAYNFFQFREKLTMVEPVDDGVLISSDRLYMLRGADIKTATQEDLALPPAILGTSARIDGTKMMKGVTGEVVLWTSEDGIYMSDRSGVVQNFTEDTVSFPFGEDGAAQFFQADGAAQYVSVLRKPSDDTNFFGVADKVTAEVYRNGILIEE